MVGRSNLADGGNHAFLYADGSMTDLNSLIDPASGWTIHSASDINDHGQIAATGCRAGECLALRLDLAVAAVPELSTWVAMLAGLIILGFAARRQTRPENFA